MILRKYQVQAVEMVHEHISKSNDRCCLLSAGGTGKSVMMANVVQDLVSQDKHVCVMVNISKLIGQLSSLFDNLGISHNVIKSGHKRDWNDDAMVHIVMQQTLYSRKEVIPKCDVLIIDEYHISFETPSMNEVIERLEPKNIIGYSATPIDNNGEVLKDVKVLEAIQVKEATEQGYLTPVRTFVAGFSEKMDFSEVDVKAGDYNEVQLSKIVNTETYNKSVVHHWLELARERKTLVFCTGVDHAEALAKEFEPYIKVATVHSKKSQKENDAIFEKFKNDEIQMLCSIGMVSTGFDEPSISCVVSCRPTKSKRLYLQQVYRADRLFQGKNDSLLLDFSKNTSQFGFYDEDVIRNSRKTNGNDTRTHENISGIDLLVPKEKDVVELLSREDTETLIMQVKEAKRRGNLKDLIELYESSQSFKEIIELGLLIDEQMNGNVHSDDFKWWIINKLRRDSTKSTMSPERMYKAVRTRLKNIIKDGKKVGSIGYFVEFLNKAEEENQGKKWFNG